MIKCWLLDVEHRCVAASGYNMFHTRISTITFNVIDIIVQVLAYTVWLPFTNLKFATSLFCVYICYATNPSIYLGQHPTCNYNNICRNNGKLFLK